MCVFVVFCSTPTHRSLSLSLWVFGFVVGAGFARGRAGPNRFDAKMACKENGPVSMVDAHQLASVIRNRTEKVSVALVLCAFCGRGSLHFFSFSFFFNSSAAGLFLISFFLSFFLSF